MSEPHSSALQGVVVEEEIRFTLDELGRACGVAKADVILLVQEGVLEPIGRDPESWRFGGASLRRARVALRIARDLELGIAGAAIVLDLLDEVENLRSRLQRAGRL